LENTAACFGRCGTAKGAAGFKNARSFCARYTISGGACTSYGSGMGTRPSCFRRRLTSSRRMIGTTLELRGAALGRAAMTALRGVANVAEQRMSVASPMVGAIETAALPLSLPGSGDVVAPQIRAKMGASGRNATSLLSRVRKI
jgi:hypothetical protein